MVCMIGNYQDCCGDKLRTLFSKSGCKGVGNEGVKTSVVEESWRTVNSLHIAVQCFGIKV